MHESTTGSGSGEASNTTIKDKEDTQNSSQRSQQNSSPSGANKDGPHHQHIKSEEMANEALPDQSDNNRSSAPTRPAAVPIVKKKGTASIVKAPKRAKPGTKKPRLASKKKTAAGSGNSAVGKGGGNDGNEAEQEGSDEASDSDSGPYCICRGPDNHRFMIACDKCEDWFHGDCINIDKYTGENLVQRYICPGCTDGKMYVTRYKKTCSLEGCEKPARIYDPAAGGSIFCCDEHCQTWWERLVATLPKAKASSGHHGDEFTREEFMGLVSGSAWRPDGQDGAAWKLGDEPFGVPPDFWDITDPKDVLTEEQLTFLSLSAAHRHSLGEEIVLCKKMLQLVDMALRRREAVIAASAPLGKGQALGKDFCGYDYRLDTVGATAAFAAFASSAAGEAVFRTGKLDAPSDPDVATADDHEGESGRDAGKEAETTAAAAAAGSGANAGMCLKKKCKPHMQWSGVLTKAVKHQIKELAAQAKEKLDAEARVRDSAAVRYRRRLKENNWVTVISSDSEMDVDG